MAVRGNSAAHPTPTSGISHSRDTFRSRLAYAINFCEVYYDFYRADGEELAGAAVRDWWGAGITCRDDISPSLWQSANWWTDSSWVS